MEVRVTDAPPEGVSKILITAENIEVNIAEAGTESGWQTVIPGPITFDLVAYIGLEGVLGEAKLQPGRYKQLRLAVVEAIITIQGEDRSAKVPSGRLRFVGGFDLVAGETTVLTLDFDAGKSVVLRGGNDPLLKPVVKLLVRMGERSLADAVSVADAPQVDETPTPRPTATSIPTPTPTLRPGEPTPTPTPRPTATPVPTATPTPRPTPTPTATPSPTPTPTVTPTPTPTATPTPPGPVQVSLSPSKDNTLYQDNTGFSNGAGDHLFAGKNNNSSTRRAVIAFDVAGSIPAGSTITSVTLTLNMSRTAADAETVRLYRLLADWGEGTSQASGNEGGGTAATPRDATWAHRFFNTDTWASPGGDFSLTVSGSLQVDDARSYTWGSTSQMVADVQAWLDEPSTDFGWLLRGNEGASQTAKRFDSRQNSVEANRPVLTIVYTPPS